MIEKIILQNLVHNEKYMRKVIPFLKDEYFGGIHKKIFTNIKTFIAEYNDTPSIDALVISLTNSTKLTEDELKSSLEIIDEIKEKPTNQNFDWLVAETERFCKESAIENAIRESINIISGKSKKKDRGVIPELLKEALAVTFDPSVGHDFFEDFNERFEKYHKIEERLPFDLDYLNEITNGGVPKKTLNIILGGINVGKSLTLCHFATSFLLKNKNVLYISCEMAEEEVAKRIDANILDISLDTLMFLTKKQYDSLIHNVRQKVTQGKLIIKEYPTGTGTVNHFRALLSELKLKKNFVPDVILIDYLNICSSVRIKNNGMSNTYVLVKAIAEEVRGLAMEMNVPIFTATQLTRQGYQSSDTSLTDISESFATGATADFIISLINTEQLEQANQIMIKQLKNRYADVTKNKRCLIGIDRSKQRLYNLTGQATSSSDAEEIMQEVEQKAEQESFEELKKTFKQFKF